MGYRRGRGFRPLGERPPELAVSDRRRRELELTTAWRRAAGPAVAARATVRVRGNRLEVRVDESGWGQGLASLLPELARETAARAPRAGIRGFRLIAGSRTVREGRLD